MMHFTQIFT